MVRVSTRLSSVGKREARRGWGAGGWRREGGRQEGKYGRNEGNSSLRKGGADGTWMELM